MTLLLKTSSQKEKKKKLNLEKLETTFHLDSLSLEEESCCATQVRVTGAIPLVLADRRGGTGRKRARK